MAELEALADAGEDVALVLAAQSLERDDRERAAGQGARPPRARPARAADRVGQLGRRPDRRGDLPGDGAAADRVLRDQAVAIARRALPPVGLDLSARVGARAAGLAAHRPHRQRVVDGQGPRAERGPRALRGAARVPARRLARRPRAGGEIGRRRAAAPRRLPERHRSRRTRPTWSWRAPPAPPSTPIGASTTSSSSAAGRPASRRRSTAPRRASGRWSSTTAASAARRPRAR